MNLRFEISKPIRTLFSAGFAPLREIVLLAVVVWLVWLCPGCHYDSLIAVHYHASQGNSGQGTGNSKTEETPIPDPSVDPMEESPEEVLERLWRFETNPYRTLARESMGI